MIKVVMDVELEDFLKSKKIALDDVWSMLETTMRIATMQVTRAVKENTPHGVTGRLAGGVHSHVVARPGLLYGDVLSSADYTQPVERGADAHWIRSGWTPGIPGDQQSLSSDMLGLIDWVRLKLGKPEGVAWHIRHRIAGNVAGVPGGTSYHAFRRTGTWGRWMFRDAVKSEKPKVMKLFKLMISRWARKQGGN